MQSSSVFRTVVEPSLDRVPVVETRHTEPHNGREIVISHIVRQNVFTDFDAKLSRHLVATGRHGFPRVTVVTRWRTAGSDEAWRELEQVDYPTVPHALASIGQRALALVGTANLRLHHHEVALDGSSAGGHLRALTHEDLRGLERALKVVADLGETEFLDISGDFDLVTVRGPDPVLSPVAIDLAKGRVTVLPSGGNDGQTLSGALYDLDKLFGDDGSARLYLAALRHAQLAAKQDAVLAFRAAAERRILDFDAALAGRRLTGHRLETAASLIHRLKAGLGEGLSGLSEHAQLTAFDWEAEIRADDHDVAPKPAPEAAAANGGRKQFRAYA